MTITLFILYLLITAIGYWLKYLNLSHLKANAGIVPHEFAGVVDPALLKKMSDYTVETSRIGTIESIIDNVVLMCLLFGGLIGSYDRLIAPLSASFIWGGVLFFLILVYAETVIGIPFSLYRNFKIENRFGFNTMTLRLWFSDLLKSAIISAILGTVVIVAALSLVRSSPAWWWLEVWVFFAVFSLFVMYISPYVIEPLFFKFERVKTEGLEVEIRSLMERAGLKVSRVFQVDASRRSRHSNAYFTGIGKVKRIVLFDTLIAQMTHDEILAVLAHEVGHWKRHHVIKRLLMTEMVALAGFFLAFRVLQWEGLPGLLGLGQVSFYARVVLVGFLGSLVMFPFTPLFSFLSRRDEREADRFASDLTGRPQAMASALVKLSRENLSNLHPHPLYAKFYYSHPPVVERIRKLRGQKTEDG
jgi:STE24 endopeptidase